MKPRVSVVVPIYNVEQYLPQCVDSIISQTLKEIEIILVDDGSPDSSGKIAEKYAKQDSRIKVLHKKNGGLSDARNFGMEAAIGEYISFIDSDDWIESNMLEDMYKASIKNNADVVVAGEIIEYINESYFIKETFEKFHIATNSNKIKKAVFHMCERGVFNVVWNKIYKREFIVRNNYKFIKDAMPAEDIIFNCTVFSNIQSLVLMNTAYYHYAKRNVETYVTRYSPNAYNVFLSRYNKFKELFSSLSLNEEEHELWLNKVYISGLNDCVINMYRKGSQVNFIQKSKYLKEKVLLDSYAKNIINQYNPQDFHERIFRIIFILNNVFLMHLTYDLLFFLRRNLSRLYFRFRKRQIFNKYCIVRNEGGSNAKKH